MYTVQGVDNPLLVANRQYDRAIAPIIQKPGESLLTPSVQVSYREQDDLLPAGVTIWSQNSFDLPEGTFDTIFVSDTDGQDRLIEASIAGGAPSIHISEAASRIAALNGVLRVLHSEKRRQRQAAA